MKKLYSAVAVAALSLGLLAAAPASFAAQDAVVAPSPGRMPATVPAAFPPAVTGSDVRSIAQVGSTMVIGGAFTAVGGLARTGVAAFNATTGAMSTTFNPVVTGKVFAVLPGPTANTVYVAGTISKIGGTKVNKIALLDLTTGGLVSTFKPAAINGQILDLKLRGSRLFIAGAFTTVGTSPRGGLATLNATTGALDTFLQVSLTERHNSGVAVAAVGATAIDITPDGSSMVVIGNFKKANGLDRDQILQISLAGPQATIRADWQTDRFKPACYDVAVDSYVEGVSYSPDGSYFVVTTTGAAFWDTLCDGASRWETAASGSSLQPTWFNATGGDTLVAVTITDSAVFVGGHMRWLNNPYANNSASLGAVPRPGLAALDPVSGRPLEWNPGRNPRGFGVYAMLATKDGLWIGSDTDWIGNRKYKRKKLAFFPYASGSTLRSTTNPVLPGKIFVGQRGTGGVSNVLYRVNAGGPEVIADDGGPNWQADDGAAIPYRNSGSYAYWAPGGEPDASVPASTPSAVFDAQRWDPNDATEMQWEFPVAAGTPVQVRLYFADRYWGTAAAGTRVFDVSIDGQLFLDNMDVSGQAGARVGTMRAKNLVSDGVIDIDFGHVVENPIINAIEIVRTDVTAVAPATGALVARTFDGVTAGAPTTVASAINWNTVRGAFTVGNQLFFGQGGKLNRAVFDGNAIGTATVVQPYHDPAWKAVDNGSGGTFDGVEPEFYTYLGGVTGMFYADGKVYFNQVGSPTLRSAWFSPDSGVIDTLSTPVTSSISFADTAGMFSTPGWLWFVSASTGDLKKVAFNGGTVSGMPVMVSGPSTGGADWRGRALFVGN